MPRLVRLQGKTVLSRNLSKAVNRLSLAPDNKGVSKVISMPFLNAGLHPSTSLIFNTDSTLSFDGRVQHEQQSEKYIAKLVVLLLNRPEQLSDDVSDI